LKQQIEGNVLHQLALVESLAEVRRDHINEILNSLFTIAVIVGMVIMSVTGVPALLAGMILPLVMWRGHPRITIRTDAIEKQCRSEIVIPWIDAMKKGTNGEEAIQATTHRARTVFGEFLTAEETQFREELGQMAQRMDEGAMPQKVAIHGNLVATEAALKEILDRTEACVPTD
jgi:hypothetical protein